MSNVVKSISIPYLLWREFDSKNPDLNFSKWVRNQIRLWLREQGLPAPAATPAEINEEAIAEEEDRIVVTPTGKRLIDITPPVTQESEDLAFLRGVEEYLAKGESVPQATLDEYHRLKEKYQDDK